MPRRPPPAPPRDDLAAAIAAGNGVLALARRYGVNYGVVRGWLERTGLFDAARAAGRKRAGARGHVTPQLAGGVVFADCVAGQAYGILDATLRPVGVQLVLQLRDGGAPTATRQTLRCRMTRDQAQRLGAALFAALRPDRTIQRARWEARRRLPGDGLDALGEDTTVDDEGRL